jgi:hypothetical protein
MKSFKYFIYSTLFCLCLSTAVYADKCSGKVDIGPAFVHLDVLEHGHTVKRMDIPAIKCDVNFRVFPDHPWLCGICLKPGVIYGSGNGKYFSTSVGLGHLIPVNDTFCITPSIGYCYTNIRTSFNYEPLGLRHLKERFTSDGLYLALDFNYTFTPGWRISGVYQYSWSWSHTKISKLGSSDSKPKGWSGGLLLEHDLNQHWSINVGGAYNESLTNEKHGIRGYGFKTGIAYWF